MWNIRPCPLDHRARDINAGDSEMLCQSLRDWDTSTAADIENGSTSSELARKQGQLRMSLGLTSLMVSASTEVIASLYKRLVVDGRIVCEFQIYGYLGAGFGPYLGNYSYSITPKMACAQPRQAANRRRRWGVAAVR